MKKNLTVTEIQKLDREAIEGIGIPSLVLMENAGRSVAQEALTLLRRKQRPRVAVFCGTGNNGGDGLVAARHLLNSGVRCDIVVVGRLRDLKSDAAVNGRILRNSRVPLIEADRMDGALPKMMSAADLLIDALFGVGLNRDIAEPYQSVIRAMNRSGKRILAVDVPSGLDADTGDIWGICVRACLTVTFSAAKKGFNRKYGPAQTGRVVVADIGIPLALRKRV